MALVEMERDGSCGFYCILESLIRRGSVLHDLGINSTDSMELTAALRRRLAEGHMEMPDDDTEYQRKLLC